MFRRLIAAASMFALAGGHAPGSIAADYVTAPMLRIETEAHTGFIGSVATDAAGRFLVSGSGDKTARVWSLPEFELLKVLRPPIGDGDEGRVDTVAMAPDGGQIAVGGVFCRYENSFCVFIFERASGRVVKRLTGYARNVLKLAWSPDGTVLAAGMGGKGGIRLLRTSDWTELARDANYADYVTALAFGRAGQLAATSWDGMIRVYAYDNNGLTLTRAKAAIDLNHALFRNAQNRGHPRAVAFSPDGSKVAVGHSTGSNWVAVLSAQTLDTEYMASSVGLSNNTGGFGIQSMAWSPDGNTLYAGVNSMHRTPHFVRIWGDGGRGTPTDAATPGRQIVGSVVALRDGGVVYATGPVLGVFDSRGDKKRVLAAEVGSFYGTTDAFKVSHDGARVEFAYDESREIMNFDVLERKLAAGPAKGVAMAAPEVNGRSLKFYNQWRDTRGALDLNGKLLPLDGISRSLALAPDESAVAIGTDARLYLYAKDGKPLWNSTIGGNLAVNVSGDLRLVVSAHADRTIRWRRRSDGRLLLTLFVAPDRKRWAIVSPSGFYDASVGGEDLIGWHVNRDREEAADFFPVSRLRARFYKPEVIAGIISKADDAEAFKLAAEALGGGAPVVVSAASAPVAAAPEKPPAPPPVAVAPTPSKPIATPAPTPPVAETPPKPVATPAPAPVVTAPEKPPVLPSVVAKPPPVPPIAEAPPKPVATPIPAPVATVAEKPPAPPPAVVASVPRGDEEASEQSDTPAPAQAPAVAQIVSDITRVLPPVVTVLSPASGSAIATNQVTLKYTVKSERDAPVTAVRTRVNGIGQASRNARAASVAEVREITVEVPPEDSEVLIFAENKYGTSTPVSVRLKWAGAKPAPVDEKPVLYVLSIGVSEYLDPENRLKFAAKDAVDFAAIVQSQKGKLYRDVVVKLLTDAKASRDEVINGFDWLQKQVTPRDVGIVLIAGHGINDDHGNYYYLPVNADIDKLDTTGVPFSAIKAHLASLHGKGLLFVDTCHSGNVMGKRRGFTTDTTAILNELSSAEYGLVVIASSTGKQFSFENTEWGNGAFTKALVEGLSGRADLKKRGRITHKMLDFYVSDRVEELTQGKQTPVNTSPFGVPDYTIAVVGAPG